VGTADKLLTEPSPAALAAPPTWVRWRILAILMAYSAMCHINRISMSVAGNDAILRDYSISETEIGLVYSAYLVVYTIFMTPGGWLIDRRGPKLALMLMGFGAATFATLTGCVGLFATTAALLLVPLLLVRGFMGMMNAPMHPGAARAISFWFPAVTQSTANGLVTGAALLGISGTYLIFGFLVDRLGWPGAFMVCGCATAILAALWTFYAADYPHYHSSVNAAERQLIQGIDWRARLLAEGAEDLPAKSGQESQTGIVPQESTFGVVHEPPEGVSTSSDLGGSGAATLDIAVRPVSLLRNRSLVWLTISYAAVGYFEYLFMYWVQYYFDKVLDLGKDAGRSYATVPNLAMMLGMFAGGWIADRLQRRFGHRLGRALVPTVGMVGGALFLVLGLIDREPIWAVCCFSVAMAAVGASEGPFWTTAIELGGPRGATAAGIFNTGGNVGGLLAPVVTPLLSNSLGLGWQGGFSLASVFCVLGAIVWLWIDPAERVEKS
jgi:MFS family permease